MIKRLLLLFLLLLPRLALADITTGLVGYWPLDEGTGTTALNAVTGGTDGTLTGGPVYVVGKVGPWAVSTTAASSQYITWGDLAVADVGTGAFTLTFWVKGPFSDPAAVLAKDTGDGADNGLHIRLETGVYLYWNGTTDTAWTGIPNDSNWHHLAVVRPGIGANATLLYGDGVQVGTLTEARTLANAQSFRIASYSNDFGFATGTFDDIRFYTRALPPGDIQELITGRRKPRSVLVY